MKYKSSSSKSLGILVLSLAVVSQAWILEASAQGAVSVDEATSADPWGDSANLAGTTGAAPAAAAPKSTLHANPQTEIAQPAGDGSASKSPATTTSGATNTSGATTPPGATTPSGSAATSGTAPLATTIHRAPEPNAHPGEEYGPPNYLKLWKNPFGSTSATGAQVKSGDEDSDLISLIKPGKRLSPIARLAERRRLIASKLYLPERILIGDSSKFTIKGPPNWRVAIAMADKDEGAKPINDHKVRLGPDRKVVAIGKIPPTGVLELYVATPIQGDLIGTYLFFEAAIWSKDDLSDTQLAETVPPVLSKNPTGNGVQIATLKEKKRGLRIVPDGAIPSLSGAASLSTVGQP